MRLINPIIGETMKRILTTTLLLTLFVFALTTTTIHNVIAQDEHDAHGMGNECDDPTEQLMVDTHSADLAFTKTELKATKGACVMFMFKNTQDAEHDFTIMKDGDEWTHLHLDDSLDNSTGPSPGLRMIHLQMPDEDITFDYLCTVTGHEAAGMKGKLVVGEGSPSDDDSLPGFGFISAFAGIIAIIALMPILRKRI